MDACEDLIEAVEAALGIEIPEEFLEMAGACMAEVMGEVGTRSLMRDSCPTMEEVKDWVEDVTGFQVPDSVEECLSGDMDACEDAIDAVEAALGIEIPEEFLDMASACMAEVMQEVGTRSLMRSSCPTMEEVKDWV